VYQNTSGKTLFVNTFWNLGGKNSTLTCVSDAVDPPTTTVAQINSNATAQSVVQLFFMVLPNYYYECQVSAGTPNLVVWVEYA